MSGLIRCVKSRHWNLKYLPEVTDRLSVKDDVTEGRLYLEELRDQVLQGLKSNKSDDELASSVTMDKYKDSASCDQWRELNVPGMARHLKEISAVN